MYKLSLNFLACALVSFAGIAAIAGPPQTVRCGQTATFGVLDCNLYAHLDCSPYGATLTYSQVQPGQPSCMYYSYNNGNQPTYIDFSPVALQLNTQYRAKLTKTDDFEGIGSVLNIDTTYYAPAPGPQPVPGPSYGNAQLRSPYNLPVHYDVYVGQDGTPLQVCGYNGNVKIIQGSTGATFAMIHGSDRCNTVDIFNQLEQYTGRSVTLNNGDSTQPIRVDGLTGVVILKLHSSYDQSVGELIYVHVQ